MIFEHEESYLASTFSTAVNSPLLFIFVQDSIMNARSRSDLDYFGNDFIFFSLGGEKQKRRYLGFNTEIPFFTKVKVSILLFT